jgi:hypothetical protein
MWQPRSRFWQCRYLTGIKEKERKNQNYNNDACGDPGFPFLLSQFCDLGFRV